MRSSPHPQPLSPSAFAGLRRNKPMGEGGWRYPRAGGAPASPREITMQPSPSYSASDASHAPGRISRGSPSPHPFCGGGTSPFRPGWRHGCISAPPGFSDGTARSPTSDVGAVGAQLREHRVARAFCSARCTRAGTSQREVPATTGGDVKIRPCAIARPALFRRALNRGLGMAGDNSSTSIFQLSV